MSKSGNAGTLAAAIERDKSHCFEAFDILTARATEEVKGTGKFNWLRLA